MEWLGIFYYKIVHVVQNNAKYRRHSKIKGNMQVHNLYQLAAKNPRSKGQNRFVLRITPFKIVVESPQN